MSLKKYSKSNLVRKNLNYNDTVIVQGGGGGGTPTWEPLVATATGGSSAVIGAYTIHTFNGNGTLSITGGTNQEIEYLMIGGGGPAGRQATSIAAGGAGGGLLMKWISSNTQVAMGAQCIGPTMYAQSGDSFAVTVGAGGVAADNNSLNNCGGDSSIVKSGSSTEKLTCFGGGGGGGGSANFIGYNGGCGGGSPGTGNQGVNLWPAGSELTGEVQYQLNFGRSQGSLKQGNGNMSRTWTVATQRSLGSGGTLTLPMAYQSIVADTTRNYWPGFGVKTSFGGSACLTYGNGGYGSTHYVTTGVPVTPSTIGSGGYARNGTGVGGNGSAGQVIFRCLNSKTVAVANVELLIVGGGGGSYNYGAGGAGGVIYYGTEAGAAGGRLTLYPGTYPITIGAGGPRSTAIANSPAGGHTSIMGIPTDQVGTQCYGSFDAFGGSSYPRSLGEWVGSGVGVSAGQSIYTYGIPHPLHGFQGGGGFGGSPSTGGGGGGAGAVGGNAVNLTSGGNGGNGKQFSIEGTATYYGGGGGGGKSVATGTQGQGGLGGGGVGAGGTGAVAAGSGVANSGGGGGGSASATATGGSGGSGVVILRYPDSFPAATSTTGSPTVTVTGGWRIYKFTASGSITF